MSADPSDQPKTARPKRRKRQPEEVKARIVEAALKAFARQGFLGASLRSIARDAGVTIQLLVYHFNSKEVLWEQAVSAAFAKFDELQASEPLPDSASTRDKIHHFITSLVQFHASRPDLLRIVLHEAGQITPRMTSLADNRTSKMYDEFCTLARQGQEEGLLNDTPIYRLFYAAVAISSLPYAVAAEYNYMVGRDPFTSEEMERTIRLIERLIFAP